MNTKYNHDILMTVMIYELQRTRSVRDIANAGMQYLRGLDTGASIREMLNLVFPIASQLTRVPSPLESGRDQ
jgi:hypothetical protein